MTLPVVFTANGPSGYNLTKSLRFRSSASAYLNRTPSASNQKTWTISFWAKRGLFGGAVIFNVNPNSGFDGSTFKFNLDSSDDFGWSDSGASGARISTNQVFRDPSAWYHIIMAVDTTQATASNRYKLYVNGSQVTSFNTSTYPTLNSNTFINGAYIHQIGRSTTASGGSGAYFDGEMTEFYLIDGQALTPSSFGSTNALTGVWQPAKYTGTYGTNGFYLPFTNTTSTSTLGNDFSGNGNTWTVNNISLTAGTTYDSMTDVPTLTSATTANYCVMNPISYNGSTLSNANLLFAGANLTNARATFAMPSSGLFYWEVTPTTSMPNYVGWGLIADTVNGSATAGVGAAGLWGVYPSGNLYTSLNGTGQTNTGVTTPALGCTFAVAYDCSTGKLWLGYASSGAGSITWIGGGSPASGTSPTGTISTTSQLFPFLSSNNGTGDKSAINFGQQGFTYTPPTGFVALNTYNLPTSTIVKGNTVMDATLYTGTLVSNPITNTAGFKPDLVWIKSRSAATDNKLTDSVRGTTKALISNTSGAETTDTQGLTAFGTGGFTVGTNTDYNNLAATYVGWQWQAGQGSTSSNTSGSITSTVSVNATAGFSVVTYTGNGSTGTVGHGLGVAPSMYIVKRLSGSPYDWYTYHVSLGNTQFIRLNTTGASATFNLWQNTTPTSSVFYLANDTGVNASSTNYVAYCWAEIAGFSKFGSYTGNGSSDGPFVYTGFRPRFLMIKVVSNQINSTSWNMFDTSRSPYNLTSTYLQANDSGAESSDTTYTALDILSNGVKIRSGNTYGINQNGATYIYMAFAENPFKNALAR